MKIYLVGGAIRDRLLGLEPKEKDWVVVGSTPEEMKKNGFKQVGKDFPVFIHPKSGEEYALARTERKSGHGYTGFEFDTNPKVTLEEDLERRDLTINAIAEDETGKLIDPFHGQEDLRNKKLRHVSDAFSEDPLRVLRLARFRVKFKDFDISPETMEKVKDIVNSGELEHLTGERIWLELYKTTDVDRFYIELSKLGAAGIFGEIIDTIPIDDLKPTNKIQDVACFMFSRVVNIDEFCNKLKIPNDYKDLAKMLHYCRKDFRLYNPSKDQDHKLIDLVDKLDIRKTERLNNFIECIQEPEKKKVFFISLIRKIKEFRLKENDQKKSRDEIIKIVKDSHKTIVQNHIAEYLNSEQERSQ